MKRITMTAFAAGAWPHRDGAGAGHGEPAAAMGHPGRSSRGYYVALENGYYDEEKPRRETSCPAGPTSRRRRCWPVGPPTLMLNWMPSALAAREAGLPVVNIAQPFVRSGLMLSCWADTGIEKPADLAGKTVAATGSSATEYPFLSWMSQLGIPVDGSEGGITLLAGGFQRRPAFAAAGPTASRP